MHVLQNGPALALLIGLEHRGVDFMTDGSELIVRPWSVLTSDDALAVRRHKQSLIRLVQIADPEVQNRSLNLSQSVLAQETVGSLLSKEIEVPNDGARLQFSQAHPRGIRVNPDDSSLAFMSLEATFRHRYFEYLTHVYNIQRLKRAQGLTARVEVPFEGYWALPDWDRSEP